MRERTLEKKVVKHCHAQQLKCYKFTSPSHIGVPDRLIMGRGKAMFLELKAPGNTPTPLQWRELKSLNEHGIFATWTDNYKKAVEIIDDFFAVPEGV